MARATKTAAGVPANFADMWSDDGARQGAAYQQVLAATEKPVAWAYEVWDDVVMHLKDKNNRSRSIASQVLCNLAKSDPEGRILKDFPKLFAVTGDEKFVTARHCLQSLWKVGFVGKKQQELLIKTLERHYCDCIDHKNWTLIRYDVIESLRRLYDATSDENVQNVPRR